MPVTRAAGAGHEELARTSASRRARSRRAGRARPGTSRQPRTRRPSSAAISSIRWPGLGDLPRRRRGGTPCRRRTRLAAGSSKSHDLAQERVRDLHQDAGAVTGVRLGAGGAAVLEVAQRGERLGRRCRGWPRRSGSRRRRRRRRRARGAGRRALGAAGTRAGRAQVLSRRRRATAEAVRLVQRGAGAGTTLAQAERFSLSSESRVAPTAVPGRGQRLVDVGVRLAGPPSAASVDRGRRRRARGPRPSSYTDSSRPGRRRPADDEVRPRPATNSTIEVQTLKPQAEDVVRARRCRCAASRSSRGRACRPSRRARAPGRGRAGTGGRARSARRTRRGSRRTRRGTSGGRSRTSLVAGRPVLRVDLQAPRQVGGLAEELLVEPVAPAADRLGDQHAGRQRVDHRQHLDARAAGSRCSTPTAPSAIAPQTPRPPRQM